MNRTSNAHVDAFRFCFRSPHSPGQIYVLGSRTAIGVIYARLCILIKSLLILNIVFAPDCYSHCAQSITHSRLSGRARISPLRIPLALHLRCANPFGLRSSDTITRPRALQWPGSALRARFTRSLTGGFSEPAHRANIKPEINDT